jgi:uncharacterized protein
VRLPFHLLAKPSGAACNLDCKYCFFLSKEALYPGQRSRMDAETLDSYIRQLLAAQEGPEINVAWQGGEPTLMGLDFFESAVACVKRHAEPGQKVQHTIQTNGVLVDDAWAAFFKRHGFLVGLSVDGPKPMHDAYRVNKGGTGTFDRVMRGFETLRRHQVDVNILCTIHAANGDHPLEVYRFFRDELRAEFIQFIPIVERATPELLPLANQGWGERPGAERPLYTQAGSLVTDRSVGAEQFGRFMIAVFDEWQRRDVGKVFVQTFDAALGSWLGRYSLCIFAPTCGNALALEHNGDVYSCDHYVEPAHRLGNIKETPLIRLVASDRQAKFGQDKRDTLPAYCRACDVRFACNGECPRNRFTRAPDGEPELNYLCAGYRLFFRHIDRPMRIMACLLRLGRYADEIMQMTEEQAEALLRGAGQPG